MKVEQQVNVKKVEHMNVKGVVKVVKDVLQRVVQKEVEKEEEHVNVKGVVKVVKDVVQKVVQKEVEKFVLEHLMIQKMPIVILYLILIKFNSL